VELAERTFGALVVRLDEALDDDLGGGGKRAALSLLLSRKEFFL